MCRTLLVVVVTGLIGLLLGCVSQSVPDTANIAPTGEPTSISGGESNRDWGAFLRSGRPTLKSGDAIEVRGQAGESGELIADVIWLMDTELGCE